MGLNAQSIGDQTVIDYEGYSLEFTVTSVSPAGCEVDAYIGEPIDVTIPSSVEIEGTEFSVSSIDAFWGCSSLTSIEIPAVVTYIGYEAFWSCSSLMRFICYAEEVPFTGGEYIFCSTC